MTRGGLERAQIPVYLAAIGLGLLAGFMARPYAGVLESAVLPVLVGLLYVTFLQVPLAGLRRCLADTRFLAALLVTNFVAVPLVVWGLGFLLPDNPAIRLGVFLVLLTPCIDYVVVFTRLGRGDGDLILAATPLLLLGQMILLPLYLFLLLGDGAFALVKAEPFLTAFFWIILIPLGVAWLTERWARHRAGGRRVTKTMGWLPVPLLALTLFLVVGAGVGRIGDSVGEIAGIVPVYVGFLVIVPFVGRLVGRLFRLNVGAGRALVFSAGTRNSLVVLPLALAVPESGALVAAVVLTQTMVELVGELFYIRWVPKLVPD